MFLLVFGILMGKIFKIKFELGDRNIQQKSNTCFLAKKLLSSIGEDLVNKEIYDENETKMDFFYHNIG